MSNPVISRSNAEWSNFTVDYIRVTALPKYDFVGFFAPVDKPTDTDLVLNTVKADSAMPMKFSLNGDQGLDILAMNSPSSKGIVCNISSTTSEVTETVTAGSSSLSYDATTDTYTYVWKTDKRWAGSCREFVLTLDDGSNYVANFQFIK